MNSIEKYNLYTDKVHDLTEKVPDLYSNEELVTLRFNDINNTCYGPIKDAKFVVLVAYTDLPDWFRVDYCTNYCIIQDLLCDPIKCDKTKCWCDFVKKISENGSAQVRLILDGSIQNFTMIVNGVEHNKYYVQLTITFEELVDIFTNICTITNKSLTLIKWIQEHQNQDIIYYKSGSDKDINDAIINGKTYFNYLPTDLTVYNNGCIYWFKNLVCPNDRCLYESYGQCWCEMLESIYENDNFIFKLIGSKTNYGSVNIIIDASISKNDSNQIDLIFSFESQKNIKNNDTKKIVLDFIDTDPSTKEPKQVSIISTNDIANSTYSFDLINLPDIFSISYTTIYQSTYQSVYITKFQSKSMTCNGLNCPTSHPCWCRLIEQFKSSSNDQSQLRIPIYSDYYIKNPSNFDYPTYWLIIMVSYTNKIFHFNMKCKRDYDFDIKEEAIWIPSGQENNPYKKFLFFDPE